MSDGSSSVLDIAERSGLPFDELRRATKSLVDCGLLEEWGRAGAASAGVQPASDGLMPERLAIQTNSAPTLHATFASHWRDAPSR